VKIVVCGSNAFREKMIEFKNKLNEMGHEGVIHPDYEAFARGEKQEVWKQIQADHARAKKENNYIGWYHDAIVSSDAILVLNYDKNGIANYVGGNTLMEIAFAHTSGKKVFLINPVPQEVSYADEIGAMYDEILYGDLSKIGFVKETVSLKELAERAREIQEEIGLTFDDILNKFTQEVGELNDAVQKRRGRFCKTRTLNDDNLRDELGDVMFNLISICNGMNIDPDDLPLLAKNTLGKFEERKKLYRENLR
jgi:NTP pyrophosphatase (non-canonical NTP hydrolase)